MFCWRKYPKASSCPGVEFLSYRAESLGKIISLGQKLPRNYCPWRGHVLWHQVERFSQFLVTYYISIDIGPRVPWFGGGGGGHILWTPVWSSNTMTSSVRARLAYKTHDLCESFHEFKSSHKSSLVQIYWLWVTNVVKIWISQKFPAVYVWSTPDAEASCELSNQKPTPFCRTDDGNTNITVKCSLNLMFPPSLLPETYERQIAWTQVLLVQMVHSLVPIT